MADDVGSRPSMRHTRHYTLEQATAALDWVTERVERMRDARERLNDEEVREALAEAGPTNGGGDPGRAVSQAFLDLRGAATELDAMDIVLRDLDRGLVLDASHPHEALPVASAVWCVLLGLLAVIASVVRVLERPDHATHTCAGAWLALAGAVAVLVGAWLSLRDERTSMYEPAAPDPLCRL